MIHEPQRLNPFWTPKWYKLYDVAQCLFNMNYISIHNLGTEMGVAPKYMIIIKKIVVEPDVTLIVMLL